MATGESQTVEYGDPEPMDALCREHNCGYICAACLGPWGFTFLDYGNKHTIYDANGEPTRQFVVSCIAKGETTEVTVHEDKRHTFEEGDYVQLREVEGMTEINDREKPAKVLKTTPYTFVLELDSSGDGSIDFAEFVAFIKPKILGQDLEDEVRSMFAEFATDPQLDADGNPVQNRFGEVEMAYIT